MNRKVLLGAVVCLVIVLGSASALASTTADEVRRLREEEQDYEAAMALAQQYLANHQELDLERQQVHFELGRAQYGAKDYDSALASLRALVGDYTVTSLDKTKEGFVVDDAQFYVGLIEHYFGDRAKGIEGYTKAIADFPQSNRRAHAMFNLGAVYLQDKRLDEGVSTYTALVDEYPDTDFAPEAQLHVGHALREQGRLSDSVAAFQRLAADWPDSPNAPTALLSSNRVLMAQEIASAEQAETEEAIVKNEVAIQANVHLLMTKYPDSDVIAQVMQDRINYYKNPRHWLYDKDAIAKAEAIVTWLRENKPGTRQGMRAVCEYAIMLSSDKPDEALFWLDRLSETARTAEDESLLFDAQFAKGRVLKRIGQIEKAREVWTALVEVASDQHLADEIRIMLITLQPIEDRLEAYAQLARDEARHRDIRSTALVLWAWDHMSEDRFEEALELVDEVLAHYADTLSVEGAKSMREKLVSLVKVPIENRGDYRER